MNNLTTIYGQYSGGNTLRYCQDFSSSGDMVALVRDIGLGVPEKGGRRSNFDKDGKARDFRDEYTSRNLNRVVDGLRSVGLQSKEEIGVYKEVFRETLELIEGYCVRCWGSMTGRERFCLEFFQAGLSSHLNRNGDCIGHYRLALEILMEAILRGEDWAGRVDVERMVLKLEKHKILSKGSIVVIGGGKVSLEEAISSRTFLSIAGYGVEWEVGIFNMYRDFRLREFSERILKVNALNALEHERFSVLFTDKVVGTAAGYVNCKNTVRVIYTDKASYSDLESTLLHELTHKAMDDVFHNAHAPYFRGNVEARDAYRESMRRTLLNLVDAVLPIDILAGFSCDTEYRWSENVMMEGEDGHWRGSVRGEGFSFKHAWSWGMTFDEVWENCFAPEGILANEETVSHLAYRNPLVLNAQVVDKGRMREVEREWFACCLACKLCAVFGGKYDISSIDAEFITNATDKILRFSLNDVGVIKPLMEYIDRYVNPEIDVYIECHPSRGRIRVVEDGGALRGFIFAMVVFGVLYLVSVMA